MIKYLMVGIGGSMGAVARFWLDGYFNEQLGSGFPYGTFFINCSGSFLIGLVLAFLADRSHWNPNWSYLVATGFIGSYTTFSTFEYETLRTLQQSRFLVGASYVGLSVTVGFLCVWLGAMTERLIP